MKLNDINVFEKDDWGEELAGPLLTLSWQKDDKGGICKCDILHIETKGKYISNVISLM